MKRFTPKQRAYRLRWAIYYSKQAQTAGKCAEYALRAIHAGRGTAIDSNDVRRAVARLRDMADAIETRAFKEVA